MSWWRLQLLKFKLDSSSAAKRKQGIEELLALNGPETVRLLVQMALADDAKEVREAAGLALKRLGDAESIRLLTAALGEADLRDHASEVLVRMPALAAAPLMDEYANSDHDVRRAIVKTLVQMGDAAVPVLTDAMKAGNLVVRTAAKEALRDIGHDPDAPPSHLSHKAAAEPRRQSPADTLKHLDRLLSTTPTGMPALPLPAAADPVQAAVKSLMSPNARVRLEAVQALGAVGDPRAVKLLVAALQDVNGWVRAEAVGALEALGWEPKNEKQRARRRR